jgi:hypothetical protein
LEGNFWSDYTGVDDGSGTEKHAIAGDGIGDTDIPYPSLNFDNFPLVTEFGQAQEVAIDIKPGSDPNAINPRSRGVIQVAVLTTDTFDATIVDPQSVQFGPDGAGIVHTSAHIEDIDGDGDLDLLAHFRVRETGIVCGDTEASLSGATFGGTPIEGSDSIITVGCN